MTPHEQRNLNDALHKLRVAEQRLRVVEKLHRFADHELFLRLAKTNQNDQIPLLFAVEKAVDDLMAQAERAKAA
jgi:hypothetical protein